MDDDKLKYQIGISLIPGIGSVLARKLIAYTGSVEGVFSEKKKNLLKIPGIGEYLAKEVATQNVLHIAEKEIEFIKKYKISALFYLEKGYPERLKNCEDSPVILYMKGNADLNMPKTLSVVGTRKATEYGKEVCCKLLSAITEHGHQVLIVSGLAFGIDIAAHRAALSNNLPTVAVLGHGLNSLYPAAHKNVAKDICKNGALITDFISTEQPEPNNFVKRNRIIAALSDATLVIESGEKGGALITADIANSYNRDVFAIPGKVNEKYSSGCNKLIKTNRASLIENAEDIEYLLGWETPGNKKAPVQKELFTQLSDDENKVVTILRENNQLMIDSICSLANMPMSKVSAILLNLEFAGYTRSLPGKVYKLI
jgi:DNA processing protein